MLLWGLAGLVLLAALVWGFLPKPVLVELARAEVGPLEVTFTEQGRTRVRDRFVISAPVAGYLDRVELEVGMPVQTGKTLASLQPSPAILLDQRTQAETEHRLEAARAASAEAEERVEAAAADQAYWSSELERQSKLLESGFVSQEQFDRTRSQARAAEATLRSARFAAQVAENEVLVVQSTLDPAMTGDGPVRGAAPLELTSPVNGVVLARYRESEGPIAAGSAILEIGDPHALEVEVEVLSRDAVKLTAGGEVRFERWGGDAPLPGRIHHVEPVGFTKISALGVEEQRVLVICEIQADDEKAVRLGDGYRVEAAFVLWRSASTLQIPTSALFQREEAWRVFVVEDGRAKERALEIGRRAGLRTQILSGLEAGERVIPHPDETIEDEIRVEER